MYCLWWVSNYCFAELNQLEPFKFNSDEAVTSFKFVNTFKGSKEIKENGVKEVYQNESEVYHPHNQDKLEVCKSVNDLDDDKPIIPKKKSTNSVSPINHQTSYIRPDVMNKNILRALRRQWKEMFDDFLSRNMRRNSNARRIFKNNLASFADYLLSETSTNIKNLANFSKNDFITYLGLFINFWVMKKELMMTGDERKVLDTKSLLYYYSHTKFNYYLSTPEVKMIIKMIFEQLSTKEFVNNHECLASNPSAYIH